ncbi:hypothetical protein IFM89_012154 [Coptis chinensis]|uniref:Uncharacterized protein n=1 Tax=Coptis chinensis TaxID=261450 RepID=A0A835MI66_9MAGN|nr:hypothetical protein IFM89_012154 [Coptis chinensis]
MTKFNVIQKKRRAQKAESKRKIHGDPLTGKLKTRPQTHTLSGKRKRKLLKKWRRDNKQDALLLSTAMEHDALATAEGTTTKFQLKKKNTKKLKVKHLKRGGKKQKKAVEVSVDAMVE